MSKNTKATGLIDISDAVVSDSAALVYHKISKETPFIAGKLLDTKDREARTRNVMRKGKKVAEMFDAQTLFILDTSGIKGQKDLGVVAVPVSNSKYPVFDFLEDHDADIGDVLTFKYGGTTKTKSGFNTVIVVPGIKKLS